ncbi:MAG: Asp-tRNA(Asn)/Glu-tRNA(Gln) amidotransferase subunit GatC [Anaerovoracaceae bacterium]
MKITDELINYIGDLSRLYLSDEDKERRKSDLSDILDYVEKLNELDTKGMPEMSQPFENVNCFREDTVTNEDKRDELLANAPERKGSYFKVFKTVDQ